MPTAPEARERRVPKSGETNLTQAEINRRRRRDRLTRLIIDNFHEGDRYLTLTYRGKLPEEEEIKADVLRFKRKLKAAYRKAGAELRHVGIIENLTGGGRAHVHLLVPAVQGVSVKQIERLWGKGFAKAAEFGGELEDARRLAEYLTKSRTEDFSSPLQTSRNLIRTEPVEQEVRRSDTYREKIRAPQGYVEIEIAGWSRNGFTAEGFPMVRAIFRRVDESEQKRRRKRNEGRGIEKGGGRDGTGHGRRGRPRVCEGVAGA